VELEYIGWYQRNADISNTLHLQNCVVPELIGGRRINAGTMLNLFLISLYGFKT